MHENAFRRACRTGEDPRMHSASDRSRKVNTNDRLTARCNRLAMVCEAMWTLLRDNMKITDDQLLDRINEIDLTDGRLDGKVAHEHAIECPMCHREVSRKFANCLCCGSPLAHDPFG